MKPLLPLLATLLIAYAGGCHTHDQERSDAKIMLQALSNGEDPTDFVGPYGRAIETLRAKQATQPAPLFFQIRNGDAPPPLGDGSCDYHALSSTRVDQPPFLGIRLRLEREGWHIAGYWTP